MSTEYNNNIMDAPQQQYITTGTYFQLNPSIVLNHPLQNQTMYYGPLIFMIIGYVLTCGTSNLCSSF